MKYKFDCNLVGELVVFSSVARESALFKGLAPFPICGLFIRDSQAKPHRNRWGFRLTESDAISHLRQPIFNSLGDELARKGAPKWAKSRYRVSVFHRSRVLSLEG